MNRFIKLTLCEIADNFDNKRIPLSNKQRSTLNKKYRYYGAQGIIDYVDDYLFDGEYILVAEDGENLKSQNSNVCNLVNGKFWVNNHAHIIKAKEGYSSRYLCYYLNLLDFKPFITGSAQPKLTKDNLNNIPLLVHDKREQHKVASVLSSFDTKIELNNRINAELEAMAKTLYDYWFVQFDFPISAEQATVMGHPQLKGKPYKSSGGKMVWNKELKREIPEGWEVNNVLKAADLLGGGTPRTKEPSYWGEDIPFFTPSDADKSIFAIKTEDCITKLGLRNSSTRLFAKGTVFITARGSVGNAMIAACDMAMNQSCYALVPKKEINYPFVYFLSLNLIHHLKVKSSGSVFKSIVSNDIKNTKVVIPPEELIKQFSAIILPSFESVLSNLQQNQQLASLRDWLLPMLMNGQVKVRTVGSKTYTTSEGIDVAAEPDRKY